VLSWVGVLAIMGCASGGSGVVIDPAGVDKAQYERDLAECQEIAKQVDSKVVGSAAGGAVVGGAIGAILGGSSGAAKGAGVGAVGGTARGASSTEREKQTVVKNCLRNRGYKVLN